jgi:hypothetical protein
MAEGYWSNFGTICASISFQPAFGPMAEGNAAAVDLQILYDVSTRLRPDGQGKQEHVQRFTFGL